MSLITAALAGGLSPAGGVAGFGDVAEDAFYTEAVQWMVDEQITTGTSASCFSPNATVSRGQAAAFIWRMEGEPHPAAPHPFDDVVADWQQDAVSWMFASGVTTGTTATSFSPDRGLTRGEVAVLIWRLAGQPLAPPHQFVDVIADWQQEAISWLSHQGITTGTSDTTFSPELETTRGQFATFLYRYRDEPPTVVDPEHPDGCTDQVAGPEDPDGGLDRHTFDQQCAYTGSASDDPIVFPGQPGASHLHDFFGVTADAFGTYETLRVTPSTCTSDPANRSSYWTPAALNAAGERIVPEGITAYYRGRSRSTQDVFPTGLRIVTDEAHMVEEPLKGAAQLFVGFPDCSNGAVDSEDHRSHMAYSLDNECPPSHPIEVPRITFRVTYPENPVSITSGGLETAHADFFMGWSSTALEEFVERCLNEGRDTNEANIDFCRT